MRLWRGAIGWQGSPLTSDRSRSLKRLLPETFAKIPYVLMAADPPLTVYARVVFAALDWHGRSAFPSCTTVSLMAGCSVRQVMRAIRELIRRGFLTREGGGKGKIAVYTVHQNPQGLVWQPLTGRQRFRHDSETSARQAEGSASQSEVGGGTPACQSDDRTPKILTNERSNSPAKNAYAPGQDRTEKSDQVLSLRSPRLDPGGDIWKAYRKSTGTDPFNRKSLYDWASEHWDAYRRGELDLGDLTGGRPAP